MSEVKITIPEKLQFFLTKKARFKVVYGGRGSGKSQNIANALIIRAMQEKIRVLCTRELQVSISDSVHKLLSDIIQKNKLDRFFTITQTSIKSYIGSEFIFKGLRTNVNEIKSLEGIDIAWTEEASKVSQNSWEVLIPTIRKDGSEIWISFNPESEDDDTYQRFVLNPQPDSIVAKVNFDDNPFFPEVLRKQQEFDKINNPNKWEHIWNGSCKVATDAQIFKDKWIVEDFETPSLDQIKHNRFFYGGDWGFAQDPTCLARCFMKDKRLYIDHEAYGVGVEIDEIAQLFASVPMPQKWEILADSARPETISYLRNRGMNIAPVKKWAGSVEEGIEFLRNFEKIVIHPRCKNMIDEAKFYSYKVDRVSGKVLPVIVDANNHLWDCIRYALQDYIKQKTKIYAINI